MTRLLSMLFVTAALGLAGTAHAGPAHGGRGAPHPHQRPHVASPRALPTPTDDANVTQQRWVWEVRRTPPRFRARIVWHRVPASSNF